jgi:ribosomal protein S18 acetylase RimI-like enzyme
MGPDGDAGRRPPPRSPPAGGPGVAPSGGVDPIAVVVRPGTEDDAARVGDLHAAGIPEGFLSLLGTGFLRLLYRRISAHDGSFLLVADQGARTVGFVAGSTDIGGLYRSFLLKDGLRAAAGSVGPLLRRWRRVLETLGHGASAGAGSAGETELLAVAVDAESQGRGAGRLLVASFLDEVRARDGRAARVVVGAANERAVALYGRAGFVTVRRFELHSGTESLVMRWGSPSQPTSGVPG